MKFVIVHLMVLLAGCGTADRYEIVQESPFVTIITGTFDRSVLQSDNQCKIWFAQYYRDYQIDPETAAAIGGLQNDIRYVIVAGTWCGDSKRELPRMFKILDSAGISDSKVTLFGVDRSKRSDDGITEQYAIHRVPTFIVLRNGSEIGRIVESPVGTLEEDLLEILRRP
jgi:hypothetical protein